MKTGSHVRALLKFNFMIALAFLSGCLESSFELASESRLPKWFKPPDGLHRNDLTATMKYYSTFSGGEYIFELRKKGDVFDVKKINVDAKEVKEIHIKNGTKEPDTYPKYYAATIEGKTDIWEHKRMDPNFYMTDDPVVWEYFGANK